MGTHKVSHQEQKQHQANEVKESGRLEKSRAVGARSPLSLKVFEKGLKENTSAVGEGEALSRQQMFTQ